MESIAPYPDPDCPEASYTDNAGYVRRELSRLAGEALMHNLLSEDATKMINLDRTISPHLTLTDLSNAIFGDNENVFSVFNEELMKIDLPTEVGSAFDVPIFFFTGKHDWTTPVILSDKWFGEINAPYKELIHFEESSHAVLNDEPGKILMALVNKVLPFAETEKAREVNNA
mgnify:CR=1 FL=1